MYEYRNLRASQVTSVFPGTLPCSCYDDESKIYKVPRYDVRIRYGTTVYGSRGRIIEEITVECDCCGSWRRSNVERYDVYQNDISW